MYGIVAVVTGPELVCVLESLIVTVSVPSIKVRVVIKNDNQSRLVDCQVSRKLVALVSSESG